MRRERESQSLRIDKLSIISFRNISKQELVPGYRFNVLYGDNGEGKTNLLEAIDYIGTLSSFRGGKTQNIICKKTEWSELKAELTSEFGLREIRIRLHRREARRVAIDGKRPKTKYEYFRIVPMVIFHPASIQIAHGSAENRRNFLDRILEQLEPIYRNDLTEYLRALRSRNRILKDDRLDRKAIEAYDELLARKGAAIGSSRERIVSEISELTQETFKNISGERTKIKVAYSPRVDPTYEKIKEALSRSLIKDKARGFTADGPHADDINIELDGINSRNFASQGQNRAIVLSLKIAELKQIERKLKRVPIFLLDDVSSELDRKSSKRLYEILDGIGGQVFLTTTNRDFILLNKERVDFSVKEGRIE